MVKAAFTETYGSVYYCTLPEIAWPLTFSDKPVVHVSVGGYQMPSVRYGGVTGGKIVIIMFNPAEVSAVSDYELHVTAKGKL